MNRYYNPKISLTMVKNTVAKMDQSLEKEMARLAKLKKKRETRSSLVDFYKKSLMMNKHFKEDLASGSRVRTCVAVPDPYWIHTCKFWV